MPVRLLKPKLRTSRKWNACTYMAQTAYVRFIMLVDDAGRYFGHPKLLASELFPLGGPRGEDVGAVEMNTILQELANKKLVELYEHEGETFVSLTNWEERIRSQSKFPKPPTCEHPQTTANNCAHLRASPPTPTPTPASSPSPSPKRSLREETPFQKRSRKQQETWIELAQLGRDAIGDAYDTEGQWKLRQSRDADKFERVMNDVIATRKEQKLDNPPAYAETLWKEFK